MLTVSYVDIRYHMLHVAWITNMISQVRNRHIYNILYQKGIGSASPMEPCAAISLSRGHANTGGLTMQDRNRLYSTLLLVG